MIERVRKASETEMLSLQENFEACVLSYGYTYVTSMISFLLQGEKLTREVCEHQGQEPIEKSEEERKALEVQFRMFVSELCFNESHFKVACLLTPILKFYCRGRLHKKSR